MVAFFIERPIFASAIAVITVLAGGICYFLLPVSQFPKIAPPQVVVTASYPGARLWMTAMPRAKRPSWILARCLVHRRSTRVLTLDHHHAA